MSKVEWGEVRLTPPPQPKASCNYFFFEASGANVCSYVAVYSLCVSIDGRMNV